MQVRKQVDQWTDCLDLVLNHVGEAVHVVNCDGITMYYNSTAAEMDGLNPADVIGKHVLQVYPSLSIETSSLMQVLATGQPIFNQQQDIVSKTGRFVTILYSTFPLYRDGVMIGACDMCRDITKIRELSERVMELQAELLDSKGSWWKKGKTSESSCFARYNFNDIIGSHESIVRLKVMGQRVAHTTSPVLVVGETGSGKELVVQSIHNASARKQGAFVAQNCAAFPATLLESILFGTVKGSFTGAEDRPGLFELAHGGTLFLDEINSMPMELQGKLLRVLQDGTLRRIGDSKIRQVDARVIACTNVEPEEAVKRNELRIDLYYRLNVVALKVPPLRERKSDISLLVEHFLQLYNGKIGCQVERVSDRVMEAFQQYSWPGNVRELQHALEHAMNMVVGKIIEMEHLPERFKKSQEDVSPASWSAAGATLPERLKNAERVSLLQAMEKTGGNISKAAQYLGLPRQTFQYKLKIYGISGKEKNNSPKGGNL